MIQQNPFSLYDFLGYFIPGALALYLLFILGLHDLLDSNDIISKIVLGDENGNFSYYLFLVIISYSFGHIINFCSSMLVETYAKHKYGYPSKYILGYSKKSYFDSYRSIGNIIRFFIWIIIIPISLIDLLFGEFLNFKEYYTRPVDQQTINTIKVKVRKMLLQLGFEIKKWDDEKVFTKIDFYKIASHYVYEHTTAHRFKLTNYVILYGFLRSLSLINVILFWYSFVLFFKEQIFFSKEFIFLLLSSFIGYISYIGFLKFYRRYTLEGLMLVLLLIPKKEKI